MIAVRRAAERGGGQHGWLDTKHTFSFADYHDPKQMGFRSLRVINEDRVQAGAGFGTHGHRDMEILSWVLAGALEHRDSMGNGSVIRPGDLQRMTAGTGVMHSEKNASAKEGVHFLQIWILPERTELPPGYEQRTFAPEELRGTLRLIGSRDGRDGSITVHQDVSLYAGQLATAQRVRHELAAGRHAWVQVTNGRVALENASHEIVTLAAGDGAALSDESRLELTGVDAESDFLLFDLA